MKNRCLVGFSFICVLFISIYVICPVVNAIQIRSVSSTLTMSSETPDLGIFEKSTDVITAQINISYSYQLFILPLRRDSTVINLSVEQSPSWCAVSFEQDGFSVPVGLFSGRDKSVSTTMSVEVIDATADAFETGKIVIKAVAFENINIGSSEASFEFIIQQGFYPAYESFLSNDSLVLEVGKSKNYSVTVQNNANYKVTAHIMAEAVNTTGILVMQTNISKAYHDIAVDGQIVFPVGVRIAEVEKNISNFSGAIRTTVTIYPFENLSSEVKFLTEELTFSATISEEEESESFDITPFIIVVIAVFAVVNVVYFGYSRIRK